jgi:hypothetical protein
MNQGLWASVITGGFGVVITLIGLLSRANKREHGENGAKLDELLRGHTRIESKIDNHINDHAKGDV